VVVGDLAQIFPDQFGQGNEEGAAKPEGATVSFGMRIENLTDRQRQTLGIKEKNAGVRITEVEPNSFADDIGLRQGDLLLSVNHHAVNSVDDLKSIQATLKPGEAVMFRIQRRAQGGEWVATFVAGTLPNK